MVRNLVNNLSDSLIINISLLENKEDIRCAGWEMNLEKNKLLPKEMDLSKEMETFTNN